MPKLSPALDRIPPQAPEAEQAALGCCLVDMAGEAVRALRELLATSDFYRTAHRHIFEAICTLADAGQPVEILTVAGELERVGQLDNAGGRAYLIACADTVAAVSRAPIYAQAVARAAVRRQLIDFGGKLIGAAYEDAEEPDRLIERGQRRFQDILRRTNGKARIHDSALPATITADELMGKILPPPRWAVPGLLPEGATILAGKPKLGKSWAVLQTALAVAQGGRALGKVPVQEGDVLYLALEDTERRLQDRMRLLLGDSPAPRRLTLAREWPELYVGGREMLAAWLDRHPEARLVVIDTLANFRGMPPAKESVYYADSAALRAIKKVADEYQVSTVVVHHVNKLKADDVFDTISGSFGLTGAADGIVVLERQRGAKDARLVLRGRDVEEAELAISFDAHCAWTLMGDAAEFAKTREQSETLALFTADRALMRSREAAELLNLKEPTARQRLCRLVREGLLVSRDGWYSLAQPSETQKTENGCHTVTDPLFDPFLSTNGAENP
jgi:replicative DNA helicase